MSRTCTILFNKLINFLRLFLEGDDNQDGKLQLRELAALLNVEKNFLDICPKKLQQKELGDIFQVLRPAETCCVSRKTSPGE